MRKAWCYTRLSDNVGCFRSLRSKTTMADWTAGYVLEHKERIFANIYTVFIDLYGEKWYVSYEATITYEHPNKFLIP
jgi:hypothetical protein